MTKTATVKELAEQIRGVSYAKSDASNVPGPDLVPVLRAGNITDNGLVCDRDLVYVPQSKVSDKQRIRKYDIVIAASSGSISIVGKAAQAREDLSGSFGAFCKVLRPNEKVEPNYFSHYFKTPSYRRHVSTLAAGANINNLRNQDLDNLAIPLPPLSEQKRIAEILDRAEALRAKRRAALALLDELTQSIFLDMFGDPVSNPKGWPTERMEDLMTIRRGGSPRPIEKFLGGTVNWIKIGDGTKGSDIYLESCAEKIKENGLSKTVFLESGSLIFANCGVSLGFARILKIDGCIHDGWLSFANIPEQRLNKLFLLKALNSITEHFRRIAPSGTQPNLNTGLMKNFKMIVPNIELQKCFENKLLAVELMKTQLRKALQNQDALFASLQHRAFRGELS